MRLSVILCQNRVLAASPSKNLETIRLHIQSIPVDHLNKQNSILVLPELCVSGYLIGDQWERPRFLKQVLAAQVELAALSTDRLAIVAGILGVQWDRTHEDGRPRLFNGAGIAFKGQWLENKTLGTQVWPKTLLPNYRLFDDSRHFYDLRKWAQEMGKPLADLVDVPQIPWDTPVHLLLGVCEDGWGDHYPAHLSPYLQGIKKASCPTLALNLSCSPFSPHKAQKRQKVFAHLASQLGCPVAYANSIGVQNSSKTVHVFDGCSQLYMPSDGNGGPHEAAPAPVAPTLALGEALREYTLSWDPQGQWSLVGHRDVPVAPPTSSTPSPCLPTTGALDEKGQILRRALSWQCQEWGIAGVVVGVSGGIDSAVVATLFVDVLGPDNVVLIYMPGQHSSPLTRLAALELAHNLKSPLYQWGIRGAVSQTLRELERRFGPLPPSHRTQVLENIQARDRGSRLLAAIAAHRGFVFSCNTNKTELTVGYGTFYGDVAGFLAPIGDLWKGEVYALARWLNATWPCPPIPEATLQFRPTAELSRFHRLEAGRGDPLHYPYHDALFKSWVEPLQRLTYEDNLEAFQRGFLEEQIGCTPGLPASLFSSPQEFTSDLLYWWQRYERLGVAKRTQAPPIVSLSRRCFGDDLRECLPPLF